MHYALNEFYPHGLPRPLGGGRGRVVTKKQFSIINNWQPMSVVFAVQGCQLSLNYICLLT